MLRKLLPLLSLLILCASLNAQTINPEFFDGEIFLKVSDHSRIELPEFSNGQVPDEMPAGIQSVFSKYQTQSLELAFSNLDDHKLNRTYKVEFDQISSASAFMDELQDYDWIEYAEGIPIYQTQLVPNDPDLSNQWYMGSAYVNAYNAYDITFGNSNTVVAIVDDAVKLGHQDLNDALWVNPGEIANNNIDDDGNGYIDDINGWDAADNDNNPNPPAAASNSVFTHGTHCAGIAAAETNNNLGVASLGSGVSLMAVKCTDDSNLGRTLNNTYGGIQYAIAAGADVISMSFGGTGFSSTVQNLINAGSSQGIVFVAAAGNSNTTSQFYPAAYSNVISVASTTTNDDKSSFSNYGSWIDISAPGSNIFSTLAGSNSSYGYQSGTSMACPMVAGLCGLILSYNPSLTPAQVENCITSTADNIDAANPSYVGLLGAGRIDADAALTCANPNIPPVAQFTADLTTICVGGSVSFTDQSTLGPTSWSWSFQGGTPNSSSQQNPTVTYNTPGVYNVTLTATNAYGNDVETKSGYITVTSGGQLLPFTEDFESGSFGTNSWTIDNPDADETWGLTTVAGTTPGNTAARMEFYYYNNATGERDGLLTPPLDFSPLTSAQLTFEYAYRRYNTSSSDSLIVYLSTDCGVTFPIRLLAKGENGTGSFATQTTSTSAFTPGNGDWCFGSVGADCDTIDLTPYIGSSNVVIKFEGYNNYGNNLFLDNINITGTSVPLKPIADFSANATTIVQGNSVNFTDQSTRNPNAWSWSFQGGSPATSSNQNPNTITYNNIGSYDVTLIASNGAGSDTITKPGYINVVAPSGSGSCDTPTNYTGSLQLYTIQNNGGYVCGHNIYTDQAKADYFDYQGQGTTIDGAIFGFASAFASNPATSKVTAHVWDGTGGTPGASLGSTDILIADIANDINNGDLTAVTFSPAINLPASGEFFLGIELFYGPGGAIPDTVALFSNTDGDSNPGTAWEQFSNGNWFPMSDGVNTWGLDISHLMYPVICGISNEPSANFVANRRFVYTGNPINFFDLTAGNPISWSWDFPGANTTTSTQQNPTNVSYSAAGLYDVTLRATNLFGSDTITANDYIQVIDLQNGCDTITHIGQNDNLALYSSTGGGYVAGHNSRGDVAKAEKYSIYPQNGELSGAILLFGRAKFANASSSINVSVWDNSGPGGAPGTRLTTESITIQSIANDITNNDYTFVSFSNPASINTEYYIGIEYSYANGDTVALVTNSIGESIPATAWEKQSNGSWNSYQDTGTWNGGIGVSHVILPILCVSDYEADFSASSTNVCAGATVQFTDQSTAGSNSWRWSFPGGIPSTSNLRNPTVLYGSPGTYNVQLIVSNGAISDTLLRTSFVTVNDAPGILFDIEDISCNGQVDGSAEVTPSGGQSPYNISWSTGASGSTINGLNAGAYSVTVTDANGCADSGTAFISEPDTLGVQVTPVQVSCNGGSDGLAMVNVTGGSFPYRYSTNGATYGQQNMINGLSAGNYTIYVKDTMDCVKTAAVTITEPAAISVSITENDANCSASDGSAVASASGGVGGFSYQWSSGSTVATAPNLSAGSYTVTVTDNNNCTVTSTATISNIGAPSVASSTQEVSCKGGANGSASLNITGGQSPYNVSWNVGGSGTTRNNLAAGTYTATITDAAGCIKVESVTVTEPDSLLAQLTKSDETCGNKNGSLSSTVTGGSPSYTYNWSSGGGNTASISSLAAGNYSLTVTDDNNCTVSASTSLVNIPGPSSVVNVSDESCRGFNDGSIDLIISGGTAPFTYNWSGGQSSQDVSNLAPGSYTVTVTDANNCQNTVSSTVGSGPAINLNVSVTNASSAGNNDGSATASASGGTGTITYSWSNNQSGPNATNLGIGIYYVTATDQNGCNTVDTFSVNVTGIDFPDAFSSIEAFPNPTGSKLNVVIELQEADDINLQLTDILGKEVLPQLSSYGAKETLELDLSELADGVYLLQVSSSTASKTLRILKQDQ